MVTVERTELAGALSRLKSAIDTKNPLSILSKVWIDGSRLVATTLRETMIIPIVDLEVNVCVNYKEFAALVAKTRQDEVQIGLDESERNLILECDDYRAEIVTTDPKQYPTVLDIDPEDFQPLPSDFRLAVSRVQSFASTDPTRYFMCGVYIDEGKAVATDGRRMAIHNLDASSFFPVGTLIPNDLVSTYISLDFDSFWISGKSLWFGGPDGFVCGQLTDGQFPNYTRPIRGMDAVEAAFDFSRENLAGSEIVEIFQSTGEATSHRVTIVVDNGELRIESANDRGQVLFRSDLETYHGDRVEFAVNYKFLISCIQGEETVQFRVHSIEQSDTAKQLQFESGPFMALLMSMEPSKEL